MNEERQDPSRTSRHLFPRLAKGIGFGIGGLLLLLCIALAAGTLWLRTESGEARIRDLAVSALKDAGITASFATFEGPLPGTLHIAGMTLADSRGVWFSLSEGFVRLRLSDLIRGQATVAELRLNRPRLERLPDLPSSPEPAPASGPLAVLEPDQLRSLGDTLKTILGHAALENVQIDGLTLGADVAGSPLVLNLSGGGPLTDFRTRFSIATPLLAALLPQQGNSETNSLPQQEQNGDRPDGQSKTPSSPNLEGSLFIGNSGTWLSSLLESGRKPDAAALLEANFPVPGNASFASVETSVPHAGQSASATGPLRLRLLLTRKGAELAGEELNLTAPGGTFTGDRLTLENMALNGTFAAELADPTELMNLAAPRTGNAAAPKAPFSTATLQGDLSGTLNDPHLNLRLHVADIATGLSSPEPSRPAPLSLGVILHLAAQEVLASPLLRADGEIQLVKESIQPVRTAAWSDETAAPPVQTENEPPAASGTIVIRLEKMEAARTPEALELRSLHLMSDILDLSGSARLADAGRLETAVSLTLPNLRLLLARLDALLPVPALREEPLGALEGKLDLNLKASRMAESDPVRGTLGLSLGSMRWGIQQAQSMLGAAPSLHLNFAVRPQPAGPEVSVQNLALSAAQTRAEGSFGLTPDEDLKADVLLQLTSLAGLDAGLSGTADIRAHLAGPLQSPALRLELASPSLGMGDAVLEQLRVLLEAAHVGAAGGEGRLLATGNVTGPGLTALRKARDLRLNTDWSFTPDALSLQKTGFRLPGASLKGELRVDLADGSSPRLNGDFLLDIENWTALSALAGTPLRGDPAHIRLRASHPQGQHIDADWSFGSFAAEGFSLRGLRGKASADDLFETPRITASAELGAGTVSAGELGWRKGTLNVSGNHDALHIDAALKGRTSLTMKATFKLAERIIELAQLDFLHKKDRRNSAGINLKHPARIGFGRGLSLDDLSLDVHPAGSIAADGRFGSGPPSLQARLQGISLKLLSAFSSAPLPEGTLDGELTLKGRSSRPLGNLELSLSGLGYPDSDLPAASLRVNGLLDASGLDLRLTMDGVGETPATGHLRLPLQFTAEGMPQPVMNRPVSGSAHWEGSLPALWRFVPLANTSLLGQGYLDAVVSGTLGNPQATATLKLVGASFEDILAGLLITDINTDVELRSHGTSTLDFSAGDGRGGTAALNGTVGAPADGLPLNLTGMIRNLAPLHRNDLDINLSGDATVTGTATAPDVHATITINKGQFRILQSFGTSIPTLDVVDAGQAPSSATSGGPGPNLDVTVDIPNQFFVRGAGLDSEWEGNLNIAGPAANPAITGTLASVRGTFDLLGKQFSLSKGQVSFSGATPPNPLLDIQVTYQAPNITALASVSGAASSPALTLSSQPPLPQDEIVAQILFGQSASSLGRMEAIQLAAELASLAGFGRGKGGVLGEVRESLGVDVLRFGSIQEGGQRRQQTGRPGLLQPGQNGNAEGAESIPALEVGKYVTDDIYVGLEQGMNGDASGVRVEIELTPNLNLEGSTTPQGSEIGVNWKKDY